MADRQAERQIVRKTGREADTKTERWMESSLSPTVPTCYFNIFHKLALSSLSTAAADHFLQPKSCSESIPTAYLDKYVQNFSFISCYMTFVLWYCWRTLALPSVEPACRAVDHSSPELDCWGRTRLLQICTPPQHAAETHTGNTQKLFNWLVQLNGTV